MRLVMILMCLGCSAQAPEGTVIIGDQFRVEATGVSVSVRWEGEIVVIQVGPRK